jgi:ankyrin repeat protein
MNMTLFTNLKKITKIYKAVDKLLIMGTIECCHSFQYDKEKRDARGRTPLMLAVTLGHLESARTLLQHATNVNTENREGWTGIIFHC